nr:u2 small nuclear ribonucleoprotein b'' [Quercus suber]
MVLAKDDIRVVQMSKAELWLRVELCARAGHSYSINVAGSMHNKNITHVKSQVPITLTVPSSLSVFNTIHTTMTASTTAVVPASQSLYLQNLPEKLQKPDLRRSLYVLFSTYAPVLDITALKTPKMRGQAHVLFRDVQGATQAMRACQGQDFYGRELVWDSGCLHSSNVSTDRLAQKISYSKNRSNTLAKLTGTFNQPETAVAPFVKTSVSGQSSLPKKPTELAVPSNSGVQDAPSPQGVKRPRVDSESEGETRLTTSLRESTIGDQMRTELRCDASVVGMA